MNQFAPSVRVSTILPHPCMPAKACMDRSPPSYTERPKVTMPGITGLKTLINTLVKKKIEKVGNFFMVSNRFRQLFFFFFEKPPNFLGSALNDFTILSGEVRVLFMCVFG